MYCEWYQSSLFYKIFIGRTRSFRISVCHGNSHWDQQNLLERKWQIGRLPLAAVLDQFECFPYRSLSRYSPPDGRPIFEEVSQSRPVNSRTVTYSISVGKKPILGFYMELLRYVFTTAKLEFVRIRKEQKTREEGERPRIFPFSGILMYKSCGFKGSNMTTLSSCRHDNPT